MYGQNWRYKMKVFRLDLLFSSVPIFKANQYFRTKLLAGGKLPWWARASPQVTSPHQRRCVSQGVTVVCVTATRRTTAMTGITTSQRARSARRSWSTTSGMSGVRRRAKVILKIVLRFLYNFAPYSKFILACSIHFFGKDDIPRIKWILLVLTILFDKN